jgi:carbon-monoxide dehydrogenase medium subunit
LASDNLIQETFPALVKAANSVGAVQTRSLATLGGNICSAVPSCDSAPILIALGAKLLLRDKSNERIIAIEDFFKGPRRSALNSGELLSEIVIPLPKNGSKANFIKLGRRKALTLAIANGAAMLELDKDNKVQVCRIALGAVGPVPIRTRKAETFLIGKEASSENIAIAAEIAIGEISPITDIRASAEYRLKMSQVIVKRALEQCLL